MLLDLLKSTRKSFYLLLSDAAKHMVAAESILKYLYSELFHVTCAAHVLHNRVMKVKYHCENVDQLITEVKSAAVKSKTRQVKFTPFGPYKMGKLVKCRFILCKKFT